MQSNSARHFAYRIDALVWTNGETREIYSHQCNFHLRREQNDCTFAFSSARWASGFVSNVIFCVGSRLLMHVYECVCTEWAMAVWVCVCVCVRVRALFFNWILFDLLAGSEIEFIVCDDRHHIDECEWIDVKWNWLLLLFHFFHSRRLLLRREIRHNANDIELSMVAAAATAERHPDWIENKIVRGKWCTIYAINRVSAMTND